MRKQYENVNTLKAESNFAKYIEQRWDCRMQKMHKHHIIDFMLLRDGVARSWLEVKCLNRKRTDYPQVILSLSKWKAGVEYYNKTELPFCFATRMLDGDFYYVYKPDMPKPAITWGGRTKTTRDKYDVEPIVHLDMVYFKEL
jgi:hypothetical protein